MYLSPFLSKIGLACLCKSPGLPRPVWNLLLCFFIGWKVSRDLSVLIRQLRQLGIQYACVTAILHVYIYRHGFVLFNIVQMPLSKKRPYRSVSLSGST